MTTRRQCRSLGRGSAKNFGQSNKTLEEAETAHGFTISEAHTKVTVEKCSLVWVIDGFSHIGCNALESPAFSAEGGTLSFVLNVVTTQQRLYDDEVPKTYIRFYLTGTSKETTINKPILHCSYEFAFNEKSSGSPIELKSGNTDSFPDGKCGQINVFNIGSENYCIEKKWLTKHLNNDALEIVVRVTASVSLETTAVLPTPSLKVPSTTAALFKTRKFSDFVIRVQETDIPVHKSVLALKSSVFEDMLLLDTSKDPQDFVVLKDTDLTTAYAMVEFFYLDAVNKLSVRLALDLLKIADKYNVVNLVKYCCSYLKKKVRSSNVVDILVTASNSNAAELKEFCFKYIDEKKVFECDDEQKKVLEQQKDLLIDYFCRKR